MISDLGKFLLVRLSGIEELLLQLFGSADGSLKGLFLAVELGLKFAFDLLGDLLKHLVLGLMLLQLFLEVLADLVFLLRKVLPDELKSLGRGLFLGDFLLPQLLFETSNLTFFGFKKLTVLGVGRFDLGKQIFLLFKMLGN